MIEVSEAGLLRRRSVVPALLAERGDMLVVAGLGAPAWDVTAAGDHDLTFPLWGAMGGAAVIGLGMAIARPDRRVLVLTGDGEMLMGVGSLATIAVQAPPNLSIVVLDNERYGETGGQRTHTGMGVDLVGMAIAAGIPQTMRINLPGEVEALRQAIHTSTGPLFAVVKIDPESLPLALPPRDGAVLSARFRGALLGPAAHLE
ncbi:thiamine pyrophosphate-dependent enzyme [Humitalea rosea]|uniref:Thiamine pyrophosphate-dependent enzyme n=1 Tax=Humitalea rosea TaxID=990373 RepID=A0A2W7IIY4_9PROT|nr:thiamine pyrophosphate-dependent enzyme [Humitalea rosea]PZW46593.1 thiamine pyrophosphate-dependent enzyme [Humitalea rosea]